MNLRATMLPENGRIVFWFGPDSQDLTNALFLLSFSRTIRNFRPQLQQVLIAPKSWQDLMAPYIGRELDAFEPKTRMSHFGSPKSSVDLLVLLDIHRLSFLESLKIRQQGARKMCSLLQKLGPKERRVHIDELYKRLAESFRISSWEHKEFQLVKHSEEKMAAKEYLASLKIRYQTVIGVCCTTESGHFLGTQKIAELVAKIFARYNAIVLLLGSPNRQEALERISEGFSKERSLPVLTPRWTHHKEQMALIGECSALVGVESLSLHFGKIMGVPSFELYQLKKNERILRAIRGERGQSLCYKGALGDFPIEPIWSFLEEYLESKEEKSDTIEFRSIVGF